MTAVRRVIDAARDLAWRSTANYGGQTAIRYEERRESHQRLVTALGLLGPYRPRDVVLASLLAAIRRAAACTFSNRYGMPYWERKEAVAQLRGALEVWDREAAA